MRKLGIRYFFGMVALLFSACGDNSNSADKKDSVDSALAVNKENKPVNKDVSDFAVNAFNGGMMEIESGKIAQEKSANPRVKNFGAMMVKDHSEANDNLKTLSSSFHVALPDSVSHDMKKEIEKLSQKNGKAFDKSYMDMMVDDHQKDVQEFRKASDKLSDSTFKTFAATTLPVLEKHLDSAKAIAGKKP